MAKRRALSTYSGMTRQEKRVKASEEMARLREASLEALTTDQGWAAFLEARVRFDYSWRNCALIAHQRPGAIALGTYSQWGGHGLQVQRGESCIRITARGPKGFRTVKLFDVLQTDATAEFMVADEMDRSVDDEVGELFAQYPTPATMEETKATAEKVGQEERMAA